MLGDVLGGGGEPGERLLGAAMGPEGGREPARVVAPGCCAGLGQVLPEGEGGGAEGPVGVSEAEEGVEEAVGPGGGAERVPGEGEAE